MENLEQKTARLKTLREARDGTPVQQRIAKSYAKTVAGKRAAIIKQRATNRALNQAFSDLSASMPVEDRAELARIVLKAVG